MKFDISVNLVDHNQWHHEPNDFLRQCDKIIIYLIDWSNYINCAKLKKKKIY